MPGDYTRTLWRRAPDEMSIVLILCLALQGILAISCNKLHYVDQSDMLEIRIIDENESYRIGDTLDIAVELANYTGEYFELPIYAGEFFLYYFDTTGFINDNFWFINLQSEDTVSLGINQKSQYEVGFQLKEGLLPPEGRYEFHVYFSVYLDRATSDDDRVRLFKTTSKNRIILDIVAGD